MKKGIINLKPTVVVFIIMFILILFTAYAQATSNEASQHLAKGKRLVESAKSQRDFVEAEMEFERAVELAPDWPEARYNLAIISAENDKPVKAIKAYTKYLELTKNPPDRDEVMSEIERLKKIREAKKRIGLSGVSIAAMQDGVYLINVLKGSKLDKAGFEKGDKIIEVNKRSTVGIKIEDFYRLIEMPHEKQPYRGRVRVYGKDTNIKDSIGIIIFKGGQQHPVYCSADVFKSKVYEIEEDEFEDEVIKNNMPTLVFFWADWCKPCINFTPVVEQVAEKYKGKIAVVSINADSNRKIMKKFNIQTIPTTMLFRDGKQIGSVTGYKSEAEMDDFLINPRQETFNIAPAERNYCKKEGIYIDGIKTTDI